MRIVRFTLRRQHVDQVIAPDRQRVAVPGHHPHVEVGPCHGEAGRDGGRPAVDRVHAVCVHVVREAGRTTYPRDEHGVLAPDAELGEQQLHRRQDAVVPAAWAPTDLLVTCPVLPRGQRDCHVGHSAASLAVRLPAAAEPRRSISSRMACWISPTLKGVPSTLDSTFASTRKSERTRRVRWPRLPSGTRITS